MDTVSAVKVEKIAIRMGDQVVELSVEDARSLLDQLKTLFGDSATVTLYPYTWPWWYYQVKPYDYVWCKTSETYDKPNIGVYCYRAEDETSTPTMLE